MSLPESKPRHRILVCDDNAAIHSDFRKILLPHGDVASGDLPALEREILGTSAGTVPDTRFRLSFALQGDEAIGLVKSACEEGDPFALAFMDVRMPPGQDGIQTLRELWRIQPDLHAVLCTAFSDHAFDEIQALTGGSNNLLIIKKPFDNVEVLQAACALTGKWELDRRLRAQLRDLDQTVERRTSELRESEHRFSRAFRASPLPMALATLDRLRILDANDRLLHLLETDVLSFVGRTLEELRVFADPDFAASLNERLERGRHLQNEEVRLSTGTGRQLDVLLSAELLDLDEAPCVLLTVQDVTGQRRLEQQLRQAQKLEAVGQLAAGIAHDFNNLLTVIEGYSGLLLARPHLDESVRADVAQIAEAAERATAVTRKLLAFSRKQVVQPRHIQLNDQIRGLQQLLARLLGELVELQVVPHDQLPPVLADPSGIEQVILNLAVNARDAMPGGGRLSITTGTVTIAADETLRHPDARPGKHVTLSVADTGTGMEPGVLAHIFEPFFTTKEAGKGTGLGLATVYGIIKQHQGWVEVASQPGRGTCFTLFLPAADGASVRLGEPAATPLVTGHATVLLVEDEPAVRKLAVTVLQRAGYRVLEAEHGPAALEVWRSNPDKIDLLLSDMVMPGGMTGLNLAGQLRALQPGLRVLLTSGYSEELLGHSMDAHAFIGKPYTPSALLKAVRNCLDQPTAT
jgi:two-component system, cell cycle sensor histidine kinase and response regulator CckA